MLSRRSLFLILAAVPLAKAAPALAKPLPGGPPLVGENGPEIVNLPREFRFPDDAGPVTFKDYLSLTVDQREACSRMAYRSGRDAANRLALSYLGR